ncbi:hypothetical protein LCGC14_1710560 [marine sediment metagenome]|uniref:Uncharacterized protein n=1 Tax=marine sediment metagenome TaxID=412755 RepID=A0A0F9KFB5_9ZZZZ
MENSDGTNEHGTNPVPSNDSPDGGDDTDRAKVILTILLGQSTISITVYKDMVDKLLAAMEAGNKIWNVFIPDGDQIVLNLQAIPVIRITHIEQGEEPKQNEI